MADKRRMLTVIHADGSSNTVTFEEPKLDVLQKKVGGYIERVQLDGSKFNGAASHRHTPMKMVWGFACK